MVARWLILLLTAVPCWPLESALVTPEELKFRVQMTRIVDLGASSAPVRLPDFVFHFNDGPPFSLTGVDKSSRPWTVELPDALREAWQSDEGGHRTYYFVGYTGGNGFAPFTWIMALSFDERGLPVPFFFDTHTRRDETGLLDALNLDGGEPELLQQDYWGSSFEDPGYYVTTLYRKRGAYWYRSDGRYGNHVFPAYERWSVEWADDRRPELVAPVTPAGYRLRDASNDPAVGVRTGMEITPDNHFKPGAELGCSTVHPDVVVEDSPRGRTIDIPGYTQPKKRWPGAAVVNGLRRVVGESQAC